MAERARIPSSTSARLAKELQDRETNRVRIHLRFHAEIYIIRGMIGEPGFFLPVPLFCLLTVDHWRPYSAPFALRN